MARKNKAKSGYRSLTLTTEKLKREQIASGRRQLHTSVLHSSQPYQRPVQEADVTRIVKNFNPLMLDDIIVSYRDGAYHIIDGQHRTTALKRINNGDCMIWCKVLTGLTYTEEAELYNKFNNSSRRLTYTDQVRAHIEAKDDSALNDIKHIIESVGFELNTTRGGNKSGHVSCLKATVNAYKLLGRDDFEWMLRLINRFWNGHKNNTHQDIIIGLSLFLVIYKDFIDEDTFVKQMSRTTPQQVLDAAKNDHSARKKDIRLAKQFFIQYNGNRRSSDVLPYRFNG